MNEEMESLKKNKTWTLARPPLHAQVLKNRWIFKSKPGPGGFGTRCKVRLLVKGFIQRYNINYEETFSPVMKFPSIRVVLAMHKMHLAHLT